MADEEQAEGSNLSWHGNHSFNVCTFEKEVRILDVPAERPLQELPEGYNITGKVNNTFNSCNFTVVDERKALLDWLSPLDPGRLHRALAIGRVAGVGDWLLDTNQFTQWRKGGERSAKSVLFCYGDPGVGKTYLSSLVIDTLCDWAHSDSVAVACVYCGLLVQSEQSTTGLLRALLRQVVSASKPIPDGIERAFQKSKRRTGGCCLLLPGILEMLVQSLTGFIKVKLFICIDGLDEFPTKHRPELWESLQQIIRACPDTRIFLTGRLHIRDEVQEYFPGTAEMLPISLRERDIELYLRMRLNRDPERDALDQELEADILRIIPEVTSRTFLLISLSMDAILAEATVHQRRQALDRVANGLGFQDAYDQTLDRIRQQGGSKSKLGIAALIWVSRSERPLRSQELLHALGVEVGAEDFSNRNVPSIRTVLGSTLGLVKIDQHTSTVRLLHFTLREYLRQHPTLFVTADSMMAEICLTYLNYPSIRASSNPDNARGKSPFLEYATCFWGTHAGREVTESVKSLSLRLLDRYEKHVSAPILWREKIREPYFHEDVHGISGLHCIAFWGIAEIAIAMLEGKKWDVNGHDSRGDTPLMWAIRSGHYTLAELLLEQGDIQPDVTVRGDRTVFSFAAESGNERAVKLLLELGNINPDSRDSKGRTALSFAAAGGHEGVVRLLLEREGVNPNSWDNNGRTPLSFAASGGHEGVVKLLLDRGDVNLNLPDNDGQTPLLYATMMGREGVVKLLSESRTSNSESLENPPPGSSFSFAFVLLALVLSIVPLSICYVYGDSGAFFPSIRSAWQRYISVH